MDPSYDDIDAPNSHTLLRLSGFGVQPYSARGLTQTHNPIQQASQNKRTVNGNLKDISFPGFRKFASTISGADQLPPAIDGVWPGLEVEVHCLFELQHLTGGTASRPVVPGSSRVEGAFTLYRPILMCRVVNFSVSTDEYGAQVSWSMELEEI
jgi:hypothetical protein